MEAADDLVRGLRRAEGKRSPHTPLVLDDDKLRALPVLITTAWLFDIVPRTLEPEGIPVLHNSDGEEVVFHRVRFPFTRGATHALVGERLDTLPALQRETTHFWNWLGDKPGKATRATGKMSWGVSMMDGTPVLGNVELKGRALILAVTSAERAGRGTALIADALAGLVGIPLTTIETVEQAMAARMEGLTTPEPAPDISREITTPLIHGMLDRQYRATLDEPVGMLGDITPRPPGPPRAAIVLLSGSSTSKTAAAQSPIRATRWRPTTSHGCGANSVSKTCAADSLLTRTVNLCPYNAQGPDRFQRNLGLELAPIPLPLRLHCHTSLTPGID